MLVGIVIHLEWLQNIAQRLTDLHLFGKAKAGGCPACIQPGSVPEDLAGRWRRMEYQVEI